jgi:D-serine deaminase-like pyridoxal phosphate-dependent protein
LINVPPSAAEFFDAGIDDILYTVGITPNKLPRALSLRRRGCDLRLVTDNVAGAEAVARFGRAHGEAFEVWIEIDVDGHRSGIPPDGEALVEVGCALHDGLSSHCHATTATSIFCRKVGSPLPATTRP